MAMGKLETAIKALAADFANNVVVALAGASFDEVQAALSEARPATRVRGLLPAATKTERPKLTRNSRMSRRSADDIEKALTRVLSVVEKAEDGMRAEQIREKLGLESKELPRILKAGLESKRLRSKGAKRATTYFVRATKTATKEAAQA